MEAVQGAKQGHSATAEPRIGVEDRMRPKCKFALVGMNDC
jgi:hypothetical protein